MRIKNLVGLQGFIMLIVKADNLVMGRQYLELLLLFMDKGA